MGLAEIGWAPLTKCWSKRNAFDALGQSVVFELEKVWPVSGKSKTKKSASFTSTDTASLHTVPIVVWSTPATCHPRKCKNYEVYGPCQFADRCSYLHVSFSGRDMMASEVNKMKEEEKILLEKIKDLNEEFDMDSATMVQSDNNVSRAHVTRPEVDSTSNKTVKQTVHLSSKPFFNLLTAKDDMTDNAILDGIANILATAQQLNETDKVAIMDEKCGWRA